LAAADCRRGILQLIFKIHVDNSFVEPKGAPSLARALVAGAPVDVSPINSFVDGAAVAKIGERNFKRLRTVPVESVIHLAEGSHLRHDH